MTNYYDEPKNGAAYIVLGSAVDGLLRGSQSSSYPEYPCSPEYPRSGSRG
jgi:hypothetical protein